MGDLAYWEARQYAPKDGWQHADDRRSPFERDRDRIIHSGAFRRLQGKTQVFGVGDADFYRTRLTHSLECAQIGRSLGRRFFADPRLWEAVESACLAHDLGHPPFGHNGEDELDELLRPAGLGFEGNAQTLRVLLRLEVRSDEHPGLNLTRGALASMVKYPFARSSGKPKYVYDEDAELVSGWLLEAAPEPGQVPFTCELMDLADDIAYSTHDVEDGIRARFITPLELRDPRVIAAVTELSTASCRTHGVAIDEPAVRELLAQVLARLDPDTGYQSGAARKRVGRHLISSMVNEVRAETRPGADPADPLWGRTLVVPDDVRRQCEVLKQLSRACVMQDARVTTIRHKGREIVRRLFVAFRDNALLPGKARYDLFPLHRRAMLAAATSDQARLRMVADYVAGMTDSFATRLYARLFLPQIGTLFDAL